MKRTLFLSLIIVGALLSACNKEDLGTTILNRTISASLPDSGAQTRTALNGLQVVWSENDDISLFSTNGQTYSNNQAQILKGVGTTQATFSTTLADDSPLVVAVYPYMNTTSYNGVKVTMTMADTYTYTENGIDGAPMATLISGSDKDAVIAFKNAGALMGLTVNNIPAGYNKAILTSKDDDKALTGECEISFDESGNPTIIPTTSATGKSITINFEASSAPTNKTFYFPIPVNDYTNLELSISNGTDTKILKTKGLNAERSNRYKSTITLDTDGNIPTATNGATNASAQLSQGKNSLSVTITEEEEEPKITLPELQGDVNQTPTFLSFESIPTGKTVTITTTTDAATVSDRVTISASSDEGSNNSFDIALPNSTVTLEANGDAATYQSVTALTAENTLIIGEGVTVKELIVKGGNIHVFGEVESIQRHKDNADDTTSIIVEDGGSIPSSIDEKFIVAPEYDETTKTYTVKHAANLAWIAKFVNGGNSMEGYNVVLNNDIDLNNQEWSPIGSITQEHGFCGNFNGNNHTIKNLKITAVTPDADGYVYVGLFGITENNTIENLVIENVNIDVEGAIVSSAIAYPYYTVVSNITVQGDINIEGGDYTAGILGYTRRCYDAKNLTINGNIGSSITGGYTVGGVISEIATQDATPVTYSAFTTKGLTITANQMHVGGICGLITSQTLDGAIVENVTINCSDNRKGIVSGSLGNTSTIKNISYTNISGATNIIGGDFNNGFEIIVNGDVYQIAGTNN